MSNSSTRARFHNCNIEGDRALLLYTNKNYKFAIFYSLDTKQTVTIYKAPQKGKGQKLLDNGFQPEDFPYSPPNADGKCYFAAPNSRSLAQDYNKYYKDGILEVTIDQETYEKYFKSLERPYQGGELIELPIPQNLFPVLNQFPRVLKPQ